MLQNESEVLPFKKGAVEDFSNVEGEGGHTQF